MLAMMIGLLENSDRLLFDVTAQGSKGPERHDSDHVLQAFHCLLHVAELPNSAFKAIEERRGCIMPLEGSS